MEEFLQGRELHLQNAMSSALPPQADRLHKSCGLRLKVCGLANSRTMVVDLDNEEHLASSVWQDRLNKVSKPSLETVYKGSKIQGIPKRSRTLSSQC